MHNKFGYYCISCYDGTKKKYYLKKMEDEKGKVWRCPHCNHMIIDWAFERAWKRHLKELKDKQEARKMSVSRINNNKKGEKIN